MIIRNFIKKNEYYDSVFLMGLSRKIKNQEGLKQAAVVMGTPLNKSLLDDMGLLSPESGPAGANDIIIAVSVVDQKTAEKTRNEIDKLLKEKAAVSSAKTYRSIDSVLRDAPDVNLVTISVPGEFAGIEARRALEQGMNVYMFSDNVPIQEEAELKKLARSKGILMMGPNCGLTFVNKIAVGLASKVKSGPIGIVGASGSGMQEVMAIIDRAGMGVSQAIGTGGRDLSDEVGGITMLQGIELLEADEETKIIVLISKPPGRKTAKLVLRKVKNCKKPVVVNFIGGDADAVLEAGGVPALTFEAAAYKAMSLAKNKPYKEQKFSLPKSELDTIIAGEIQSYSPKQRYLRGIFCGGTLAEEAMMVMRDDIDNIYSNAPLIQELCLDDPFISYRNCVIDIGEKEFTRGKPHSAIDPTPRVERFVSESQDPGVAVILLDFLLGYGMHHDPAGVMADAVTTAIEAAKKEGRHLTVVASLCGTALDPQNYEEQKQKLCNAGVLVMPNNAQAARLAGMIISERELNLKEDHHG